MFFFLRKVNFTVAKCKFRKSGKIYKNKYLKISSWVSSKQITLVCKSIWLRQHWLGNWSRFSPPPEKQQDWRICRHNIGDDVHGMQLRDPARTSFFRARRANLGWCWAWANWIIDIWFVGWNLDSRKGWIKTKSSLTCDCYLLTGSEEQQRVNSDDPCTYLWREKKIIDLVISSGEEWKQEVIDDIRYLW